MLEVRYYNNTEDKILHLEWVRVVVGQDAKRLLDNLLWEEKLVELPSYLSGYLLKNGIKSAFLIINDKEIKFYMGKYYYTANINKDGSLSMQFCDPLLEMMNFQWLDNAESYLKILMNSNDESADVDITVYYNG